MLVNELSVRSAFDSRKIQDLSIVDNSSGYRLHWMSGIVTRGVVLLTRWSVLLCNMAAQSGSAWPIAPNDLDRWAYQHDVVLDFSRPNKNTEKTYGAGFCIKAVTKLRLESKWSCTNNQPGQLNEPDFITVLRKPHV